ncbi:hypothetical protein BDA96_01G021200 [Sorghum bicolor]|uniref:Uncharacterized protein n=1 Tax=Sorghum bicolor TaxID=4558 RepID=A0A921RW56_SORBI|nr:hypothetical protein BDA96_01G021200 [Sorghum bicolor]
MMKLEKLTLPHRASRDTSKGARTLEEISPERFLCWEGLEARMESLRGRRRCRDARGGGALHTSV